MKCLLIDPATSGSAGAYVDEIKRALGEKFPIEFVVNYHFQGTYGHKFFYRYSELSAQKKFSLGRLRLYVRALEMLWAFFRLFILIKRRRVTSICYALSSNIIIEYVFLWSVKRLFGVKVAVVCHDVIPFLKVGENLRKESKVRGKFYELADVLIVHNENSRGELIEHFATDPAKIQYFRFPLYESFNLGRSSSDENRLNQKPVSFLFIGSMRPEKGVDILLQAWELVRSRNDACVLTIAGHVPKGCDYAFGDGLDPRLTVIAEFLDDDRFGRLIGEADCVVLPYTRGTNSAVASSVLAAGRDLIVSDIPMFINNELIPQFSFFKSGDIHDLAERMSAYAALAVDEKRQRRDTVKRRMDDYRKAFKHEARKLFASLT
jgi:glycosyltransferase involved in cell wall biosynthesis